MKNMHIAQSFINHNHKHNMEFILMHLCLLVYNKVWNLLFSFFGV
jgi:hypothetical protein